MTITKVELTFIDKNGDLVIKSLTNEDAELWNDYLLSICDVADIYGFGPNWGELEWEEIRKINRSNIT